MIILISFSDEFYDNSFLTLIFKNQTQRLCHKDYKPMIT
jgi:hypothetical protein